MYIGSTWMTLPSSEHHPNGDGIDGPEVTGVGAAADIDICGVVVLGTAGDCRL